MSMTDTDKGSADRKSPDINAPDKVQIRRAHKTVQSTYRRSGTDVKARMVFMQGGIMWLDNDGNVTAIILYLPEVSPIPIFGIIKPGFDVFDDGFAGTVNRPKV